MSSDPSAEPLRQLSAAVARARAARHGFGPALGVLGLVTAGALPLYVLHGPPPQRPVTQAVTGPLVGAVGGSLPNGGQWAALYWLAALPLAYAATVAYYRARGRRLGVQGRVLPAVVVGLLLLVVLFASSPATASSLHLPGWVTFLHPRGDLASHGLTPLVAAAIGLLALAYLERSTTRVAFAVAFMGVALLVNLYDLENLLPVPLGASVPAAWAELPNLGLAALVLLAGGLWFGLAERGH